MVDILGELAVGAAYLTDVRYEVGEVDGQKLDLVRALGPRVVVGREAGLVEGINVYGASCLADVVNHFVESPLPQTKIDVKTYLENSLDDEFLYDFKDVKGQHKAKKALEIAAAGGHNMLMSGSPGSGKTLMAKCFASILPPLTISEAIELTKI